MEESARRKLDDGNGVNSRGKKQERDLRDRVTIKMPERGIACEIRDKSERYKSGEWDTRASERANRGRKENVRSTRKEDKPSEVKEEIPHSRCSRRRYVPVVLSSGSLRVCVWLSLCVGSPRNRPHRRSRRRLPRRWQRLANSGGRGGRVVEPPPLGGRFERRRQYEPAVQ